MPILTKESYKALITDARLMQIINNDDTVLEEAEQYALGLVREHLVRYDLDDIDSEYMDTYPVLKRWVQYIVLYQVWQRVPDKQLPERVVNNYDETLERLRDIEDGKASTALPIRETTNTDTFSKFRWGGNARRSH